MHALCTCTCQFELDPSLHTHVHPHTLTPPQPLTRALSPASPELSCEFDVTIEISEDDGKANYSPVPMDKDCFKLRQRTKKKVVFTVAQPNSARPLVVERWVQCSEMRRTGVVKGRQ